MKVRFLLIGLVSAGLAACAGSQHFARGTNPEDVPVAAQRMMARSGELHDEAAQMRARAQQYRNQADASRSAGDLAHGQELTKQADDLDTEAKQSDLQAGRLAQQARRLLNTNPSGAQENRTFNQAAATDTRM